MIELPFKKWAGDGRNTAIVQFENEGKVGREIGGKQKSARPPGSRASRLLYTLAATCKNSLIRTRTRGMRSVLGLKFVSC